MATESSAVVKADFHDYRLVPVEQLVPYEQNPRTHTEYQVKQIRESIREFGFTNPLLIDESNSIIAGHGRYLAAKLEGMRELPAIVVKGLTDTQRRALVIADNQLALNAGWDAQALQTELAALIADGFDVSLVGFSEAELADLMSPRGVGMTDPEDAPAAPSVPVSRLGDVWLLGRHRVLCGDATSAIDVRRLLAGLQPHLMVTDPPYGVEYDPKWRADAGLNKNKAKMGRVENDNRSDWREAWSLFPGDVAYVWHASWYVSTVQASLEAAGFCIRYLIIWGKDRFSLGRGHYHWQHEPCWYAVRDGATASWHGDRSQSTLWNIAARETQGLGHSTQKPIECMMRPIENNSSVGQAVYDPFLGSGTTLIACQMSGRHCYALEISPAYVDVAVERWQNFTGSAATHEESGHSFAQLKVDRLSG